MTVDVLPTHALELDHRAIQSHGFALLDPMQVDPDAWTNLPGEAIVPSRYASQPHLFPVLIELDRMPIGPRVSLLDHMEAWWRQHGTPFFSALLVSTHGARGLRQHLASRMTVRRPDGEDDVLRIHDPRVFRHLRWILDVRQMARLLGPISAWSWCEPDGTWIHYVNDPVVPSAHLERLDLDARQWGSVQRLGEINQGLAILARKAPALPDDAELACCLDILLAEAWIRYRLAEREDRWLYAEQAVRFGKGIHRHPYLQQCLQQAGKDTVTYVGACADLDDAAMRRMAMERLETKERA